MADDDAALGWAIRNEARIERTLSKTHRLISVTVGPKAGVGLRLDRFLSLALPRMSRSMLQRWLDAGWGTSDGKALPAKHKVAAGQHIELRCELPPGVFEHDEPPPLDILFDEDGIVIVNKPPGILAHQAGKVLTGTLLNQIQDLATARGIDPREARLVNRIDRDTSGIVVCTTNSTMHSALSIALQAGEFHKEYRAICHGVPTEPHGDWRQPIRDDPTEASIARQVHPDGQACHTEYEVLHATPNHTFSLLRLTLHTGRQHQIRVHAAANGHALIGDWVYGEPCKELPGQALHAAVLEFPHPLRGDRMRVEAPLTPELDRLWQHLQHGGKLTKRERAADEMSRLGLSTTVIEDADILPTGWRRPSWLSRDELMLLSEQPQQQISAQPTHDNNRTT